MLALADDAGHLAPDFFHGDFQRSQHARGDTVGLAQQAEQEVLGTDVVVTQVPRLFLGEDDNLSGPFGEPFEHHAFLLSPHPGVRKHLAEHPGSDVIDLGIFKTAGADSMYSMMRCAG